MTAWFAAHKKALAAFVGTLAPLGGALLSLGVLSGPASHNVAVILAALTPVTGTLAPLLGPANGPKSAQAVALEDAVTSVENAARLVARAWGTLSSHAPTATLTYGPSTTAPASIVRGGVVDPPPTLAPVPGPAQSA